jgi:hypothetical protein
MKFNTAIATLLVGSTAAFAPAPAFRGQKTVRFVETLAHF